MFVFCSRNLTWRDVQYLLIYSSNSDYAEDDHWQVNGAGLKVSHWYGFGIIDSAALVNRARYWSTVPPRHNCTFNATAKLNGGETATEDQSLIVNIQVENCELVSLEHVQVFTSIQVMEGSRKDISIHLVSPAGTNSILLPFRPYDYSTNGFSNWPFMTVHSWGEKPNGNWIFTIEIRGQTQVNLSSLELVLHGSLSIPSSVMSIPSVCHQECARGCAKAGPQYCDSCEHFRVASSLECVAQCPQETYINGNVCSACSENCVKCKNPDSCQKCLPTYFLLQNASCLLSCPSNFYATYRNTCMPCHQSCLSCNGPLQSDCTQCHSQFVLVNSTCVLRDSTSCGEGTYFDHRSHECRSCHQTCSTCTAQSETHCTSCYGKRQLNQGMCTNCGTDEYFDSHTSVCIQCPKICKSCLDSKTCLSCQKDYYLTFNGKCVSICPDDTAADNSSFSCVESLCQTLCSNCSNITECYNCSQGPFYMLDGFCLSECPAQYFSYGNVCRKCSPACQTCSGPLETNCLSCSQAHFLNNASCVTSCPTGTFANEGKCVECMEQCTQCSSSTSCEVCANNHFFHPDIKACVQHCPTSYFADNSSHQCKKCPSNCSQCLGSDCTSCQEGYYYYAPNRACVQQCPDGYYSAVLIRSCLHCELPCATCTGAALNCSSCTSGMAFHLESQKCKQCCAAGKEGMACCDCMKDSTNCVYYNTTKIATVPLSRSSIQIVAGVVVFALLLVLVTIAILNIVVKHKWRKTLKYKALPKEDYCLERETEIL